MLGRRYRLRLGYHDQDGYLIHLHLNRGCVINTHLVSVDLRLSTDLNEDEIMSERLSERALSTTARVVNVTQDSTVTNLSLTLVCVCILTDRHSFQVPTKALFPTSQH
jgi:hypothetical protein